MVTNMTQVAVDSLVSVVAGGTFRAQNRLQKNTEVYDLRSQTVTATIRQLALPNIILDGGAYEDIAVTVGNSEFTAAEGGVQFDFTIVPASFPVPSNVTEVETYFIQYHTVQDNYYAQIIVFGVRRNVP